MYLTRPTAVATSLVAAASLMFAATPASASASIALEDSTADSMFGPIEGTPPEDWVRVTGPDTELVDGKAVFVVDDITDGRSMVRFQADGEITVLVEQDGEGITGTTKNRASGEEGAVGPMSYEPGISKTITVTSASQPIELQQVAPTGQEGPADGDPNYTTDAEIRERITDIYAHRGLAVPGNFEAQVQRVKDDGTEYFGMIRNHAEREARDGEGTPLEGWSHTAEADMAAAASGSASTVRIAFEQPPAAVSDDEVLDDTTDSADDQADMDDPEPKPEDPKPEDTEVADAGEEQDFGDPVVGELPYTGGLLALPLLLLGVALVAGGRKLFSSPRN